MAHNFERKSSNAFSFCHLAHYFAILLYVPISRLQSIVSLQTAYPVLKYLNTKFVGFLAIATR